MKGKLIGLLGPVVSGLGYELVEIEWSSAGHNSLVRIYIDRTDGAAIGLDDCERVSRSVGAVLEAEDLIGHEYRLEVSSPGFDRPLRTAEHFERFAGQRGAHRVGGACRGTPPVQGPAGAV
jgi:ribosome maturation factor RimP